MKMVGRMGSSFLAGLFYFCSTPYQEDTDDRHDGKGARMMANATPSIVDMSGALSTTDGGTNGRLRNRIRRRIAARKWKHATPTSNARIVQARFLQGIRSECLGC